MRASLIALAAIATNLVAGSATTGCSKSATSLAGKSVSGSINSGGYTRTFIVDFPQNYASAPSRGGNPLVMTYHGATRTSAFMQDMTQFSNPAFNPDHVIVYPQGYNDYWQGSPYHNTNVNDIQFTTDLLNYLENNYCLDSSRIYASGHSNGGGFVNTIACWPGLSGRFAAFAPVSAAVYVGSRGPNDVCTPDHKVTPMLELHGMMDPVILYNGGSTADGNAQTPPILYWLRNWVMRNCGGSDASFVSNGE